MQQAIPAYGFRYLLTITREYNYPVTERGLRLGSQPGNDVVLPSPYIAPSHAVLWVHQGRCYVQNLHPAGFTAVNGLRVTHSAEVRPGDSVAVGNWLLRLSLPADRSLPATPRQSTSLTGRFGGGIPLALASAALTFVVLLSLFMAFGRQAIADEPIAPTVTPVISISTQSIAAPTWSVQPTATARPTSTLAPRPGQKAP